MVEYHEYVHWGGGGGGWGIMNHVGELVDKSCLINIENHEVLLISLHMNHDIFQMHWTSPNVLNTSR